MGRRAQGKARCPSVMLVASFCSIWDGAFWELGPGFGSPQLDTTMVHRTPTTRDSIGKVYGIRTYYVL